MSEAFTLSRIDRSLSPRTSHLISHSIFTVRATMGGSRRHHKGQGFKQSHPSYYEEDATYDNASFIRAFEETEEGAHIISWEEIVCVLVTSLLCMLLSIGTGFAARVSISIHYSEPQSVPYSPQFDGRELGIGLHQRVTIVDPSIGSINSFQSNRNGLDLGQVITVSKSGQRSLLTVVEKSEPLGLESQGDNSSSDSRIQSDSPQLEPPRVSWSEMAKVEPKLCSDGQTYGFDRWSTFKDAVQEVNAVSAERYLRWTAFFAMVDDTFTGTFDNDALYYEEIVVLTICPGAILKARKGPIFINAENIIIECEGCTIDVGGSHLSFGPHARNIHVRGVTFRGAHTSSLVFFHDGAEATFEACLWTENTAAITQFGAVADVNSTSKLNFYRCHTQNMAGSTSTLSLRAK